MARRSCDGCLGTERCWICGGEGCERCGRSGRCHLCTARVVHLDPPEDARQPGVVAEQD